MPNCHCQRSTVTITSWVLWSLRAHSTMGGCCPMLHRELRSKERWSEFLKENSEDIHDCRQEKQPPWKLEDIEDGTGSEQKCKTSTSPEHSFDQLFLVVSEYDLKWPSSSASHLSLLVCLVFLPITEIGILNMIIWLSMLAFLAASQGQAKPFAQKPANACKSKNLVNLYNFGSAQ